MFVTSDSINPIRDLSSAKTGKFSSLNPTDKKAVYEALVVLSHGVEPGVEAPDQLQEVKRIVSGHLEKLHKMQNENTTKAEASCLASIFSWIRRIFKEIPFTKKIQSLAKKVVQQSDRQLVALRSEIRQVRERRQLLEEKLTDPSLSEDERAVYREQRDELTRQLDSLVTRFERFLSKTFPSVESVADRALQGNMDEMRGVETPSSLKGLAVRDLDRSVRHLTFMEETQKPGVQSESHSFSPERFREIDTTLEVLRKEQRLHPEDPEIQRRVAAKTAEGDTLTRQRVDAIIRALSTGENESRVAGEIIQAIDNAQRTPLSASLPNALRARQADLPRNLLYFLIAGTQTVQAAYLHVLDALIAPEDAREYGGTLVTSGSGGETRLEIDVQKNADGVVEKISFTQVGELAIHDSALKSSVITVPTRHTITVQIDGGNRIMEESLQLDSDPKVMVDTPRNRELAQRIKEKFGKGFSQRGVLGTV